MELQALKDAVAKAQAALTNVSNYVNTLKAQQGVDPVAVQAAAGQVSDLADALNAIVPAA